MRSLGSSPPLCLAISGGVSGSYRSPSPTSLRQLVHPLISFRASSEFFCPRTRLGPPSPSHPSMGLPSPLRDISQLRPCDEPPQVRHLAVLGVSHALDGFRRCWPCGFISPHSHVRDSPFRGFPSRTGACLVDMPCPHVVSLRPLLAVAHQRHVPKPRPQGLTVRESVACEPWR